jgi:hypothetical protein
MRWPGRSQRAGAPGACLSCRGLGLQPRRGICALLRPSGRCCLPPAPTAPTRPRHEPAGLTPLARARARPPARPLNHCATCLPSADLSRQDGRLRAGRAAPAHQDAARQHQRLTGVCHVPGGVRQVGGRAGGLEGGGGWALAEGGRVGRRAGAQETRAQAGQRRRLLDRALPAAWSAAAAQAPTRPALAARCPHTHTHPHHHTTTKPPNHQTTKPPPRPPRPQAERDGGDAEHDGADDDEERQEPLGLAARARAGHQVPGRQDGGAQAPRREVCGGRARQRQPHTGARRGWGGGEV